MKEHASGIRRERWILPIALAAFAAAVESVSGDGAVFETFPICDPGSPDDSRALGISAENDWVVGDFTVTLIYENGALVAIEPCRLTPPGPDCTCDEFLCVCTNGTTYHFRPWGFIWGDGLTPVILPPFPDSSFHTFNLASSVEDATPSGNVAVGASTATAQPGRPQATVWYGTTPVGLGYLEDPDPDGYLEEYNSSATGVSDDGTIVVGWNYLTRYLVPDPCPKPCPDFSRKAFRWTAQTGMVDIGELSPRAYTEALDISGDGGAIVGQSDSQAFIWTEADGMVALPELDGDLSSQALAVSNELSDGTFVVVGKSIHLGDERAVRWTYDTTEEEWQVAEISFAHLCDSLYPQDPSCEDPFFYEEFYRPSSEANGVSADGAIVSGWVWPFQSDRKAFIWDPQHDTRIVNDFVRGAAVSSQYATDLSGDGRVIAGYIQDSDNRAWKVELSDDLFPCLGDLNDDGVVNNGDLLILLGEWGTCPSGPCPADLNDDGVVDVSDMNILLANWGPCP